MKPFNAVHKGLGVSMLLCLTLFGCGGGTSDDSSVPQGSGDPPPENTIYGTVIDGTGNGISGVSVYTTPVTGKATTDSNGVYTITDGVEPTDSKTNYTVHAEKTGYSSESTTISIYTGSDNQANFTLDANGNGLYASDANGVATRGLRIEKDETETSFLLSSTVDNNTFAFSSDQDWVIISPSTGQIDTKTNTIITVTVDKTGLKSAREGIIINANGSTSQNVQLALAVGVEEELPPGKVIIDGNGGVVIEEEEPQPVPPTLGNLPMEQTIEGFSMTLSSCTHSGTNLVCNLVTKRTASNSYFRLYAKFTSSVISYIYDTNGNAYKASRVTQGTSSSSSYTSSTYAVSGLTINGSITFEDVPNDINTFQLLKLETSIGTSATNDVRYDFQYQNIDLGN